LKIKVHKERCSGCHICEMVCSLVHTGRINIERSAIRIRKDDLGSGIMEPKLCRQCRKMNCLDGSKAENDARRSEFLWDEETAERCPYGSLHVFDGKAHHCDLCGGRPQCVKVCTTGAIHL
jgi:carbon-monoxide dehydrogenase iron sulfur subunit